MVRESDGSKSPGPDGFNFVFVKEFWYLIKHEVRIMFDLFMRMRCYQKVCMRIL